MFLKLLNRSIKFYSTTDSSISTGLTDSASVCLYTILCMAIPNWSDLHHKSPLDRTTQSHKSPLSLCTWKKNRLCVYIESDLRIRAHSQKYLVKNILPTNRRTCSTITNVFILRAYKQPIIHSLNIIRIPTSCVTTGFIVHWLITHADVDLRQPCFPLPKTLHN